MRFVYEIITPEYGLLTVTGAVDYMTTTLGGLHRERLKGFEQININQLAPDHLVSNDRPSEQPRRTHNLGKFSLCNNF